MPRFVATTSTGAMSFSSALHTPTSDTESHHAEFDSRQAIARTDSGMSVNSGLKRTVCNQMLSEKARGGAEPCTMHTLPWSLLLYSIHLLRYEKHSMSSMCTSSINSTPGTISALPSSRHSATCTARHSTTATIIYCLTVYLFLLVVFTFPPLFLLCFCQWHAIELCCQSCSLFSIELRVGSEPLSSSRHSEPAQHNTAHGMAEMTHTV